MRPAQIPRWFLLPALALLLGACSSGDAPYASLEVAAKGAYSAALSRDGRLAAVGSLTHGGSLWAIEDRERRFNWNHRPSGYTAITALAFSPDGAFVISAEGETLVLWSTRTGEALTFFRAPAAILALALGPDGRLALLGLDDDSAVLFDARRGGVQRVLPHDGRVLAVALDREGRRAITGSADHSARLWDLDSGAELQRWQHDGEVRLVAISGNATRALSVSKYDRSAVWDAESGAEIGELQTYPTRIVRGETFTAARFAEDGERLLTGTTDGRVQLWELSPPRELASWQMPRRNDWKRAGTYLLDVGFGASEGSYLGAAADGFIHHLRPTPAR